MEKITRLSQIKDEKIRNIVKNGMDYHKSNADNVGGAIGITTGGGLGVASGFRLISLMTAEGNAGAAIVTSGLASIGAVFGGECLQD